LFDVSLLVSQFQAFNEILESGGTVPIFR
jgi:hypothetical protein